MGISYSLKKTALGGHKILYKCPSCSNDLESSLKDAGNADKCPVCGHEYRVPGESEANNLAKEKERRHLNKMSQRNIEQDRDRSKQKGSKRMRVVNEPSMKTSSCTIPMYSWMKSYALILTCLGLSIIVISLVAAFLVFFFALRDDQLLTTPAPIIIVSVLAYGIPLGFFLVLGGQIMNAFRDIAQNSWRIAANTNQQSQLNG